MEAKFRNANERYGKLLLYDVVRFSIVPKWNSFRLAVVKFPISGGKLLMNTFLVVLATTNTKERVGTSNTC